MREINVKVYQFDELSEEAQQKALYECREYGLYDWHLATYEDAEQIGLKITGFDIDRGSYCKGEFTKHPLDVVRAIIENHGEQCDTYKTAMRHAPALKLALESEYENAVKAEEHEFLHDILEDYLVMLSKEYEYQISDEAVKEMIEANEYEFLDSDKRSKF